MDEFDYSESLNIQFCKSCLEGKQARTPFPQQYQSRAEGIFELVHTDVYGKINAKSLMDLSIFVVCGRQVQICLGYRFIDNCRSGKNRGTNHSYLTVDELSQAENYWLLHSQKGCFHITVKLLH